MSAKGLSTREDRGQSGWSDSWRIVAAGAWLAAAGVGWIGVRLGYGAYGGYWKWHFGDIAPETEACLLLLCIMTSFLVRNLLFPREADGRNRNPRFLVACTLAILVLPIVFMAFSDLRYRYPVRIYYPFWAVAMAPVAALTFEVTYAIFWSYRLEKLIKFCEYEMQKQPDLDFERRPKPKMEKVLSKLHERLQADTNALIWMYGLMAYFMLGYFADVFIVETKIMTGITIVTLASILFFPWHWSQSYVEAFVKKESEGPQQRVDRLEEIIQSSEANEEGCRNVDPTVYDRLEYERERIEILGKLKAQFSLKDWALSRRKDLLPVIGLNLVTPFMHTSMALKILHKLL